MNAVWGDEEPERAARVGPPPHVPNPSAGGEERGTPAGTEMRPGGSHQQLLSAGQSPGEGERDGAESGRPL